MTQLWLPEENSVARIAEAVFQDLISSFVPGSGVAFAALREFKNNKINQAHEILISEISKGRVHLDREEIQYFIPIAYRYFKAAEAGTQARNVTLLARLIQKEITASNLLAENYFKFEPAVRDLCLEELVVLSIFSRRLNELGELRTRADGEVDDTDGQVMAWVNSVLEENKREIGKLNTCLSVDNVYWRLRAKGWLTSWTTIVLGSQSLELIPSEQLRFISTELLAVDPTL